ncbi:sugar phosphate isomerase/epimerase family protein [Tabrizicola sp.]|uniref:sugar phosphate isomerase/epimerase family protein n=1 Tax=Tabrizicola sp. TaxID=2005166 RepID=UPI0026301FFB|nr:sugar phosphate isomerase/epimerase family protein [Tabrizicola sp.]MDM7932344.1 sugar phosphate isomerase/epimerase family protein [Tabrizicola sp.]
MTTLPILGAALGHDDLAAHRDWLLEAPRDLELQTFVEARVLDGDWSGLAAETVKLLDGHAGRLGIHGPFWGFTIASYEPEVRKIVTRRLHQALDVCAAVRGTHVVIHSPFTTWGYNHRGLYPGDGARLIEAARDTLAPVLTRASDMGVTFMLENIEDVEPADRAALCAELGWQALELSVDTGHAHYAHVSTGAPPVDFYLRAAGARLGHVHLQDADGFADRHWQIGHGTILWPSVFKAIAETGANPRLILELRDKSGVIPSARHLTALGLAQ